LAGYTEYLRGTETDEDLLLKQALEMSMQPTASDDEQTSAPSLATRDFSMMSEDEQVAYAMQMSMDPTSIGQFVFAQRFYFCFIFFPFSVL